ncbi:MAG: hypothetical protein NT162_00330, partial [Candidatus Woesebacteria bacterium]|nr:hypothetical protein [Candidatus Woesebacteria bacterium]
MISQLIQQYRFCGTGIQYDPLAIQDQIINSLIGVPLVPLSKTVEVGEKDKKEKVEIFIVA